MIKNIYHCEPQQRLLKTLDCLFGHEINGLTPGQIAKSIGTTPSKTTRDLWNLKEAGFVEYLPDNTRVRLSPNFGRKALSITHAFARAQEQLDQLHHRFMQPRK